MFKKISPNCKLSSCGGVFVSRVIPIESAENSTHLVRDSDSLFLKDYPKPEVFGIQAELDAGVPLKEVNTAVFDRQTLDDGLKSSIEKTITINQTDENK